MGFIRRKNVNGYTYYYYVEKKRVNGKPVDAVHLYLGSAENILKKVRDRDGNGKIKIKTYEFGKIAALLTIDEELGFRRIVNEVTKKRDEKGMTVGDYLLITIFGRWCGPLSKAATGRLFSESFFGFAEKIPHKVNAQNIIANMEYINKKNMQKIEMKLGLELKRKGITPDVVVWDTTNNFTFIQTGEEIPRKGKGKQGRSNKNLIGLGLAVSGENIPIFHETVPGNTSDSTLFKEAVDDIIERLEYIGADPNDVVLIFDRGNNSKDNIAKLKDKIHVLGALKRSQVPELFKLPLDDFTDLYQTKKDTIVKGYSTKLNVFGRELKIVVTFNRSTRKRQKMTFLKAKKKIMDELSKIKASVERIGSGRKTTPEGAVKRAVKVIPDQYVTVFKYRAFFKEGPRRFDFWIDDAAEKVLFDSFGRQAIFTDMDEWSPEKIAKTYNRKTFIEDDFHWLTDKLLIPLTPVWLRKDEHIRVHVFLCVIGLLFVRYLSWKLGDIGISDEQLMDELGKIRVGFVSTSELKNAELVVEEMNALQAKIFTRLDLGRYLEVPLLGR
jgi:transposase